MPDFGFRVGAYIIDYIIINVIVVVISGVVGLLIGLIVRPCRIKTINRRCLHWPAASAL